VSRRITPETFARLVALYGGCVASLYLGAGDACRDRWGNVVSATNRSAWELDHVGERRMGKAPDGTIEHVVILCSWHHQYSNVWRATAHRPELRMLIRLVVEEGMTARQAGRNVLTDAAH